LQIFTSENREEISMERTIKVPFQGKTVDGLDMDFKSIKEDWNEYQINDGTIVRMKVVVVNIAKVTDKYDNEGNPVYIVKTSNVLAISAPEKLKKGTVAS
jgi:hypothetical protein